MTSENLTRNTAGADLLTISPELWSGWTALSTATSIQLKPSSARKMATEKLALKEFATSTATPIAFQEDALSQVAEKSGISAAKCSTSDSSAIAFGTLSSAIAKLSIDACK